MTVLTCFAFDIHRFLPLRIQWLCSLSLILLFFVLAWLIAKIYYNAAKTMIFKTHVVSGPLGFIIALAFMLMLTQVSSIRRETEVARFLKINESRLKEVIESNRHSEIDPLKITQILADLNVRLIKGRNDSYHFELYSFLGYGYRIVFTEDLKMEVPKSPGGSPTLKWHNVKQNWFYYSYLD
jgi:hypothetical protein